MSGLQGMSSVTGKALDGAAHLGQSVADIIFTLIGSRTMRRDYGSMVPLFIDQPLNQTTRLLVFAATAIAIARWEPRVRIKRVGLSGDHASGAASIDLEGELVDVAANAAVLLSIPIRRGGIATAA